jgi:hypothetical protein
MFVALGLIGVWLLHNKAFLLSAYSLFHTPFLLHAASIVPNALYVLPSFHKHSPALGLPPFCLPMPLVVQISLPILYPSVAIVPSHLSYAIQHTNLGTYNTLAKDMAEVDATFTVFGDYHPL